MWHWFWKAIYASSCFPQPHQQFYSILMRSNVSIALRVKRCHCEKHLLCLSAPSALFFFGTVVCKGTGQEEDARRHNLELWERAMPLRREQDLLSGRAQVPLADEAFAGMCFFRDSCASGRSCLALSAACGKRWFVSLYWWIIFQHGSRRWPSDQLHKLLLMDWSDMQELLDHSVQELCPLSFLHPPL